TEQGRQILQQAAGTRPQVAAVLKFLPPAQTPLPGKFSTFTIGGQGYSVPLGSLTGSATRHIDNNQFSTRLDQRVNYRQTLSGRFLFTDETDAGAGQVTPPRLTTVVPSRQQAANVW